MKTYKRNIFKAVLILVMVLALPNFVYAGSTFSKSLRKTLRFGNVAVSGTPSTTKVLLNGSSANKIDLSSFGLDGSLEYFHGMYYKASLKKSIKVKSIGKGSFKVKKGTEVIILNYNTRKGKVACAFKDKKIGYVPIKKLKIKGYIFNSSRAYMDSQVEEWVASRGITSKTKYMFVVSKFNQHGWILTKSGGKWVCKYVLKVGTGAYLNGGYPNDIYGLNSLKVNTHYKNKSNVGADGKGISYASKEGGNQLHTGKTLQPTTHGCISMSKKDYNFVYWYLPVGTRVVLF